VLRSVNRYVEAEILNHRSLRHPHVIEFKEVFVTSEYICIAMEFASGGSLFTYVQRAVRLKEAAARWFFQQLIIGLDYCHRRGVVNRDIKLENTLLQMVAGLPLPLLKICDFGYSKAHHMSAPKSKVGTLAYMAPEIIKATGNYDGKLADIWSCGVMLYVMLFGQYPFETQAPGGPKMEADRRIRAMMDRIVALQWSIPDGVEISAECRDLLGRMLVRDPDARISMAEIHKHPWFTANLPAEVRRARVLRSWCLCFAVAFGKGEHVNTSTQTSFKSQSQTKPNQTKPTTNDQNQTTTGRVDERLVLGRRRLQRRAVGRGHPGAAVRGADARPVQVQLRRRGRGRRRVRGPHRRGDRRRAAAAAERALMAVAGS
jgi:serine/threonine-protein kinase SRK2